METRLHDLSPIIFVLAETVDYARQSSHREGVSRRILGVVTGRTFSERGMGVEVLRRLKVD